MKTYKQLQREFDKKVEKAQKLCPHKNTYWADHWWAMGHYSGYQVKICRRCNKVLEEKPTEEEREAAKKKFDEDFKKANKHLFKKQIGGKRKC